MENASKALIMAGSVLIALMIIGALILMFSNLTAYQETNTSGTRSSQIVEFNNQFETYNRTDVRGSDLYSLLNKTIDYNRRQSTAGTRNTTTNTWADSGEDIAYEPMTIEFTIDRTKLSADNTNRLFDNNKYTVSGNSNSFENTISTKIDTLEDEYGQSSLTNLTTNLTKIFITTSTSTTEQQKQEAVNNFNSASRIVTVSSFDEIKEKSTIREDVYTYYEYIQFKRAYFNCTDIEYNKNTGRIVKMVFEFNGEFN